MRKERRNIGLSEFILVSGYLQTNSSLHVDQLTIQLVLLRILTEPSIEFVFSGDTLLKDKEDLLRE